MLSNRGVRPPNPTNTAPGRGDRVFAIFAQPQLYLLKYLALCNLRFLLLSSHRRRTSGSVATGVAQAAQ